MSHHHQLHLDSSSSSSSFNRRHPLLLRHTSSSSSLFSTTSSSFSSSSSSSIVSPKTPSFGEVAGGTTAECAAICCCCCPFGLVNLLVLTIYKVPATLYKAAIKRKRREKLIKKGILPSKSSIRCKCGFEDYGCGYAYNCESSFSALGKKERVVFGEDNREVEAIVKLEKEMWDTFYETGFWRSTSQREHLPPPPSTPSVPSQPALA